MYQTTYRPFLIRSQLSYSIRILYMKLSLCYIHSVLHVMPYIVLHSIVYISTHGMFHAAIPILQKWGLQRDRKKVLPKNSVLWKSLGSQAFSHTAWPTKWQQRSISQENQHASSGLYWQPEGAPLVTRCGATTISFDVLA